MEPDAKSWFALSFFGPVCLSESESFSESESDLPGFVMASFRYGTAREWRRNGINGTEKCYLPHLAAASAIFASLALVWHVGFNGGPSVAILAQKSQKFGKRIGVQADPKGVYAFSKDDLERWSFFASAHNQLREQPNMASL